MILSLWFPNWPIQRLRVDQLNGDQKNGERLPRKAGDDAVSGKSGNNEADEDVPLVLYAMSKNALRVSARCHRARKAGVSAGMPLAEAKTVLGEPVDVVEHESTVDRERLRELAVVCRQFSPICGLDDEDAPDGLLLDIAGCGHLYGDDEGLAREAVCQLASLGYRARAGVGRTVGIAWAAARTARSGRNDDGIRVVTPASEATWLDRQPVEALRIRSHVAAGLADFDLRTVGQVRQLPREQLPSRFGDELLRRLDQAGGTVPEPIEPVLPLETPQAGWRSEYPIRQPNLIDIVLARLLGELAEKLPDSVGTTKLDVVIAAESKSVEFEVAFARPTRDAKRLVDLVSLRMERLAVPCGVDRVRVRAAALDLIAKTQTDLFGDPLEGENEREFSDLIERLSGRLGADRVQRAHLTPDPLPERAVEWSPAIGKRSQQPTTRTASPVDPPALFTRPTTLLRQPVPLRLWVFDHRPTRIEYAGQLYDVANCWGPERIEAGWWREDDQQRDYYTAELTSGDCLWVFWAADRGQWFLHGVF